jgi:myxalamid-type polyketide synthase MxaE and MxaD
LLVSEAAEVLRCRPEAIDPSRPLREFGLDSLRALELRNRVETALGVRIPATIMWRYPALTALAKHVHARAQEAS